MEPVPREIILLEVDRDTATADDGFATIASAEEVGEEEPFIRLLEAAVRIRRRLTLKGEEDDDFEVAAFVLFFFFGDKKEVILLQLLGPAMMQIGILF